jgi:phosphatidate cytidylyltransferase
MSDDAWRAKRGDDDEFGPPLFGDDEPSRPALSFDDNTGPLPHWTEPPTGEMPSILVEGETAAEDDDLDVWSSFAGQGPVWSDDDPTDATGGSFADLSGGTARTASMRDATGETYVEREPSGDISRPVRSGTGRITIGTDPTDEGMRRPMPRGRAPRGRDDTYRGPRPGRPSGSVRTAPQGRAAGGVGGRDMPTAVFVGAMLATLFIVAIKIGPQVTLALVVVVIGLAAIEFFEKVSEKGYQPASVVGIVGCLAGPLAAYFYGDAALPLVMALAFVAAAMSFIGAPNLGANPMPNMAITTLGVTWIGLGGSFAGLLLGNESAHVFPSHAGTDTLLMIAIAVVANDVGALFVGSAAGKTPLRAWISPNKSVEGFIGGTAFTIVAMIVVGVADKSDNWDNPNLIFLGIVVAIMAPIGDLTESMFKRNLDIKDFGSLIRGHGGVLDRFDGFLVTLPAVYYLTLVLTPWQAALGS